MQKTIDNELLKEKVLLIKYIFLGLTNEQIAKRLNCSKSGVSYKICQLFNKYKVKNSLGFIMVFSKEIVKKNRAIILKAKEKIEMLEKRNCKLKNSIAQIVASKHDSKAMEFYLSQAEKLLLE